MSEMIERVAEAIALENVRIELSDPDIPNDEWDRLLATAAIEAMREPTETMLAAMRDPVSIGPGKFRADLSRLLK